jgi:two-component system LytT family response regulator
MSIRTVLADDEQLARNRLRKFLGEEADIEIVGECANGPEAVNCISQQRPDAVFLDLHMPELDGLQVIRALPPDCLPAIVFVTAHDEHAVEAFAIQATDYLLKPFTHARLREAVRRVRLRLQNSAGAILPAPPPLEPRPPWLTRFAVKEGNQTLFVRIQDVDYIEAAANYAVLCTPDGNHIVRETLRNLESSLPPERFVRISRSIIVNLDRIRAIRSNSDGESHVVLEGGREFLMTRGLKDVQNRLQYSPGGPPS